VLKSVKDKVAAVYIGLVVTIVLLGMATVFYMSLTGAAIDGLIVDNYNSLQRLNSMSDALNRQQMTTFAYLYADTVEDSEGLFNEQTERFYDKYNAEDAVISIPEEVTMLHDINAQYTTYCYMFGNLIRNYDIETSDGMEQARDYFETMIVPQRERVTAAMDRLYLSNENALFARRDQASETVSSYVQIIIVLFALAAAIGLFLAYTYTNKILAPLYEITETIHTVGREGSMGKKIGIRTKDEFALLFEEFNSMTGRLDEFERSTMGTLMSEKNRSVAIVRSITDPLIALDSEYNVLMFNDSFGALFGLDMDITGRSFAGLLESNAQIRAYFEGVDYHTQETRDLMIVTRDEYEKYYDLTVTPISAGSGVIMVLHDITEMKKLDKAKNDFIATVSHEFKTPLTSIVMGVDLLSDESIGSINEDQREIVGAIKEDSERLSDMVRDILELSRIESSLTVYKLERCILTPIIAKSVEQFSYLADKNGVKLRFFPDGEQTPVMADSAKIRWVVNNLLSNAVKYTSPGDSIAVRETHDDNHVYISVRDTGAGIQPDMMEHMFERYAQPQGYEIEMRGSGLGLALSKEIIDEHKGKIWCQSKLGEGSTFTFFLNRAEPERNITRVGRRYR